jgi:hypothetical protein
MSLKWVLPQLKATCGVDSGNLPERGKYILAGTHRCCTLGVPHGLPPIPQKAQSNQVESFLCLAWR